MKTNFEYSIAALSILISLLGVSETILQIYVIVQVKQQEHLYFDWNDACSSTEDDLRCHWLQLVPFTYNLTTGPNTLSLITGVLSALAGGLTFIYIVLRQVWISGFVSIVICSVAVLLGSASLIYVFVKEHVSSHVSLSDFMVGPA